MMGDDLRAVDLWWRAANYLSVGQIYLRDNALLTEPLRPEHIKPRLLGHWGTCPGLNMMYAHMNRAIRLHGIKALWITGPGHGGPAVVANTWLEDTYPGIDPAVSRDARGMARLFQQFSTPGGIPSHVAAEVPGSIHEGGELGYALAHAYGAVFDNPDLIVCCVIGDGEAETGPLAASWPSHRFLDARRDGAVLPVLHLNGYKIANPTISARIPEQDLLDFLRGVGHEPLVVAGDEPDQVHEQLARAVDRSIASIEDIRERARAGAVLHARWPMIVLTTPKGWTGPVSVDGLPVEGTARAHQVPLTDFDAHPERVAHLEEWMRSYRPDELFGDDGSPVPAVLANDPGAGQRMSDSPHANGGLLMTALDLPDPGEHAIVVDAPGEVVASATQAVGAYLAEVMRRSEATANFRLFGPDETASNRLGDVFAVTARAWSAEILDTDTDLAPDGRVMEVLSEHLCQGWLEGYLLTGRHGVFNCYEAFIHIVDSMVNQHAKWLKVTREIPWRRPIPSLNYLLTSHTWRQDHNGFSHQDPGFIDHVANKKPDIVRVYLPPDANTLLLTMDACLRTTDKINVIVAGKQPQAQWLGMDEARVHFERGAGIWDWAGTERGDGLDVVLTCAGDVPTLEALAAAALVREHLPDVRLRLVNVLDLMRLQPDTVHPSGMSDAEFDALFTTDVPVIFAYHGYPWLIHRLTYRRANHPNIHVRGYIEEGTTTTPFDMVMLNRMDRYQLVIDVIDRIPGLASRAAVVRQHLVDERVRLRRYTRTAGEDHPVVGEWRWSAGPEGSTRSTDQLNG